MAPHPILYLERNLFVVCLVSRLRTTLRLRHAIFWLGHKLNAVCKNLCALAVVALFVLILSSANLPLNRYLLPLIEKVGAVLCLLAEDDYSVPLSVVLVLFAIFDALVGCNPKIGNRHT